jgi:acyl-CoA reductase-like NAD-dependent aldehyde dehydrogenase
MTLTLPNGELVLPHLFTRYATVPEKSYNLDVRFERQKKHGPPAMTTTLTTAPVATHGFFLDGRWREDGDAVEIRAPYDGSLIARVIQGRHEHAEAAIAAAAKAFGTTRRLPAFERQRVLRQISAGIAARKEEFATTLAQEAGKPIKGARVEVERSIFTFNVAAEESTRLYGEYLPLDWQEFTAGRWGIVRRFPLGPIAGITPFNFPLNLVAHKVAPAIAAGCSIVLKPAPQTPLCSLLLAECVQQAGWPDGGLNVLPLSNDDTGLLVTDDRIKLITFTGSVPVGWDIKRRAGKKKVLLELGGNAAVIVHSDADLAYAAERCVTGGFGYSGQTCISVQRILVEHSVYGRFTDLLVEGVKKLKIGDPLDSSTDVGPLIRESDAVRTAGWIEEAMHGGARVLCGGHRLGMIVEPTVLTGTNPGMKVNRQEVFGPVVTVEPYTTFDEALHRVNHSAFGLQAGLFTRDAKLIFQAYDELEVGGLIAGDVPSFRIDHMPYGGVKDSGLGREGLRYAIEEMTEPKLLVMNLR